MISLQPKIAYSETAGALSLVGLQLDDDVTSGGSKVFRYSDKDRHVRNVGTAAEHFDELAAHLSSFLGDEFTVFHELLSQTIHLDVLMFRPVKHRDHWVLITSGMSDLPMSVRDDVPNADMLRYAELVIGLPGNWFGVDDNGLANEDDMRDPQRSWPVGLIKWLARFPHEYNTAIGYGHSFPNDVPAVPYAETTRMSGCVLSRPSSWTPDQIRLRMSDGRVVTFLSVIPVYGDEMTLKLSKGMEALEEAFDRADVTEVLDPTRPSAIHRRGWLGYLRK